MFGNRPNGRRATNRAFDDAKKDRPEEIVPIGPSGEREVAACLALDILKHVTCQLFYGACATLGRIVATVARLQRWRL